MLKSLNVKINIAIATVLVLVMGLSAYVTQTEQQSQAMANTKAKAQLLTQTVTNIIRMDMESPNAKDLEKLIRVVGQFRDIETLRIFSPEGVILHSADPGEIHGNIDEIVMSVFQSGDMSKPFRSEEKGHLSFCRVEVMYNEPACHRCHGDDTDIIGVLEVCLSMATTDEQIRKSSQFMIMSTLGTMLIVGAAISLLTTFIVKRPISNLEKTMRRAQGGNLNARVDARSSDEIGRLGKSFNDMISRLDESNREIERLHREQMSRAERLASIGEMAASVAHEIKNPLAGLSGAAHVLSKSFGPEDPREQATKEMLKLTGRLDKTINDLLSFARVVNPSFQAINPNDVIEETLFFLRKESRDSQCEIADALDSAMPDIEMDPKQIQQVLFNLLINARQACGAGGKVTISSHRFASRTVLAEGDETEFIEIRVSDNGPGIATEVAADIFKPFFTTKNQGTGLGLPISRNIVEAHGGTMAVDTAPGQGSVFYVWLRRERLSA